MKLSEARRITPTFCNLDASRPTTALRNCYAMSISQRKMLLTKMRASTVVPIVTHWTSLAEIAEPFIKPLMALRMPSTTSAVVGTFTQLIIEESILSASNKTASVFVPEEGEL